MVEHKKLLSKVYQLLCSFWEIRDVAKSKWEKDLQIMISNDIWERICSFEYKFSFNIAMRKNRCQVLHRWYLTPSQLSKMYSNIIMSVGNADVKMLLFPHLAEV